MDGNMRFQVKATIAALLLTFTAAIVGTKLLRDRPTPVKRSNPNPFDLIMDCEMYQPFLRCSNKEVTCYLLATGPAICFQKGGSR